MNDLTNLMNGFIHYVIDPIRLVIFAAGLFFFVYGAVEFLWKSDKPDAKDIGRKHMLWGIFGMFVMASVAPIIALLANTFGIDTNGNTIYVEQMQTPSSNSFFQ